MKRHTLIVFERGQYIHARALEKLLHSSGVDAKIVTKHAIQVHPDQVAEAEDLAERWVRGGKIT